MPILYTIDSPKKIHWKIEVDGRNFESEEEIFNLVKDITHGNVYYNKTNFGDTKAGMAIHPSRKKNFSDGYWVYSFWFPRKKDAALFKLMAVM